MAFCALTKYVEIGEKLLRNDSKGEDNPEEEELPIDNY